MEAMMISKTVMATLALATAATAMPLAAQSADVQAQVTWNREAFWRGAPEGLRQRIDWLQQRIDNGVRDGSLDRYEARRAQRQLDVLRQQARDLDNNLDDLSRSIHWSRRDTGYAPVPPDPYATDYDAARYYRADPRYQERRLGPNDEVYRGSDGRYYCKRSDGTTGLIIGGVGGALLGNVIDGGRHRAAGTLIGGALGALLGKSVDQNSDVRCR
jgi:hypothetical protein